MFTRIVKMSFHEENIPAFLENFEIIKDKIRNAPGNRLLELYQDKTNKCIFFTYSKWETEGKDPKLFPNWSHVYKDLAHLKNRHAISFNPKEKRPDDELALTVFQLYFQDQENLKKNWKHIVGDYENSEEYKQIIYWISDLINVGWQLCSNISSL